MSELVPVSVAQDRLLSLVAARATGEEPVPLGEARGRVLARAVVGERALPGCDNSAMDGLCGSAPTTVPQPRRRARCGSQLSGEARAGSPEGTARPRHGDGGSPPERRYPAAPTPSCLSRTPGQDGEGAVLVLAAPRPGQHVRRAGEDARCPGRRCSPPGRRLRPVDIAACAAAGAPPCGSDGRPRVAVLSGGDELVPVGAVPAPHQVTDSNAAMLAAAMVEAGGEVMPWASSATLREAVREPADWRPAGATWSSPVPGSALAGTTTSRGGGRAGQRSKHGAWPCVPASHSSSAGSATCRCSGCRGTRPARRSPSSCSAGRRCSRSRAPPASTADGRAPGWGGPGYPRDLETYLRVRLSDARTGFPSPP